MTTSRARSQGVWSVQRGCSNRVPPRSPDRNAIATGDAFLPRRIAYREHFLEFHDALLAALVGGRPCQSSLCPEPGDVAVVEL
jgi:hypothetical protein